MWPTIGEWLILRGFGPNKVARGTLDVPPRGSPQAESYETFLREQGGIQLGTAEFMGGIDHAYGLGYMLRRLRAIADAVNALDPKSAEIYGNVDWDDPVSAGTAKAQVARDDEALECVREAATKERLEAEYKEFASAYR